MACVFILLMFVIIKVVDTQRNYTLVFWSPSGLPVSCEIGNTKQEVFNG